MRAIWKGAISFGLVTIPVRLYPAVEERSVAFHQVRRSDGSRVRYKRVAEADGQEVPYAEIAKGYELPGGEMVVLSDEDLADLPLPTSRIVDVVGFVPLDQVDPIYFAKSYYLEPDKTGTKPYVLLRDALEQSGMVGLVKVAIRSRETLGALRARDGVIVLETMAWPDEVRTPEFSFLNEDVPVRPAELAMANTLIDSMAGDFDPSQYSDDYREALQQVIEAKIAGRELVPAPSELAAEATGVVDLMAALRASVAAAKRSRGEAMADGTARPADAAQASTAGAAQGSTAEMMTENPAGTARKAAARTKGGATPDTEPAEGASRPARRTTKRAPSRRSADAAPAGNADGTTDDTATADDTAETAPTGRGRKPAGTRTAAKKAASRRSA